MPSRRRSPPGDRRRRPRREAADTRLKSPTLEVELVDLSEGGVAVECHRGLRIGARYRFTLEGAQGETSFEGTVLWCRLRNTRSAANGDVLPVYRAGIARADAEAEDGGAAPDDER